jgi:hypothetical protein
MLLTAAVREMRGKPGRFRLIDTVERRGDPPLRGDDIGAALQQLGWEADGNRAGHRRELRRHLEPGGRVAAGERLERAQRLPVRVLEVAHAVAIHGQIRAREGDVRSRRRVRRAAGPARASGCARLL